MAGAVALAGLATTQAFAPGPALAGLGRRSAGLALARQAARPALRNAGRLVMQEAPKVTTQEVDGFVEFLGVDASGNPVTLNLAAREKLYLDATSAWFNEGISMMADDDYDQLKNDLAFEGRNVGLMSREEIKFMVAASRYAEGKPIMSDAEFDDLRRKLKASNSKAVIHEMPVCKVDTQKCKSDLVASTSKNFVINLPALIVSTILVAEISFYVLPGLDPLSSLVVDTPFIAALTYGITNFILFQKPLITVAKCPRCQTEQPIFFGDVLFVDGGNAKTEVKTKCVNKACAADLVANKDRMVVETDYGQAPPPPPLSA
jgi:hypothetical protein